MKGVRRTLPPAHDTILPFTRFVIGPGDFTPTVFNPKELRGYPWASELAQAIVFTSPFLCYADHPTNYLNHPALDMMKTIPSTWDETVVLPGSEIGKCAAFARRRGKQWFIGVINGGDAGLSAGFSWTRKISDDPIGRRAGSRRRLAARGKSCHGQGSCETVFATQRRLCHRTQAAEMRLLVLELKVKITRRLFSTSGSMFIRVLSTSHAYTLVAHFFGTRPVSLFLGADSHHFAGIMNDCVGLLFHRHACTVTGRNENNPEGALVNHARKIS